MHTQLARLNLLSAEMSAYHMKSTAFDRTCPNFALSPPSKVTLCSETMLLKLMLHLYMFVSERRYKLVLSKFA